MGLSHFQNTAGTHSSQQGVGHMGHCHVQHNADQNHAHCQAQLHPDRTCRPWVMDRTLAMLAPVH